MNSEKIMDKLLKINFKIKNKFFSRTKFEDSAIEEQYQENVLKLTSEKQNTVSTLVVFLGYLATVTYIIIAFYKMIYIINCLFCFSLALLTLKLSNKYRSRKALFINNHIQVFLSGINIVSKGFILCFAFNTEQNDNVEEMLRIIIYDFFSTNIYLVTRLEANIFVSCFYFSLNLSLVIIGSFYSIQNRFYYLEGITSFCVFVIFYALRKQCDYNLRLIFAGKKYFEKYVEYTNCYLEGLNGYKLNLLNNRNISYGLKINCLMSDLVAERFFTEEEIKECEQLANAREDQEIRLAVDGKELNECNESKNKEKGNGDNIGNGDNKMNEDNKGNGDNKGTLFNKFFNEFDCLSDKASKNKNKIVLLFLKKLILFDKNDGQYDISKKEDKNINTAKAKDKRIQSKLYNKYCNQNKF